jgi:hypothetical protein
MNDVASKPLAGTTRICYVLSSAENLDLLGTASVRALHCILPLFIIRGELSNSAQQAVDVAVTCDWHDPRGLTASHNPGFAVSVESACLALLSSIHI